MKRILIFIYSAFLLIILANIIYYKSLYNKQIDYITTLLDHQVQIVGITVDDANNSFASDLSEITFGEDFGLFFSDPGYQGNIIEKMKQFSSKYNNFITGIKIYDNKRNEFTLKLDEGEWLDQQFILHEQNKIYDRDTLVEENKKFEYYLAIIKNNTATGNIVVSVDYGKYFDATFSVFNLKDYQWQWVVSDSGVTIYDNYESKIRYSQTGRITDAIESGSVGNLIHNAIINGDDQKIISSYYSTQLLQRNLVLVFSAPTSFFQKYIIRNSLFIVLATLLLVQVIIYIFWRYLKKRDSDNSRSTESEKMLLNLIEEMPAGVIILNKNKEILLSNKVAAAQYSYSSETEIKGMKFPETSLTEVSEYFSRNPGGVFDPAKFAIINKETGETILYKNSIPVVFMGEEAEMLTLVDITELESARKKEAKGNISKSEFLARMSYEIRTPLTWIIGMTDILTRHDLTDEVKEIVNLLRHSTEVLLNIINDILDFSKIETGKMILEEVPFNLREEIDYCTNLARTCIADKEITFAGSVDKNVPVSIIADPFRLRQVLTNLINHSVRNTEKGEIQLKCRMQSSNKGIVTLDFELLDTGKSFDNEDLKKIYGETLNIETIVFTSDNESVFGPVLAGQLIRLMGGELTAESPSGISGQTGTRIMFTVRVYSNDRIEKKLDLQKIRSFDKIKTLVITGQQNRDEETLNLLHQLGLNISVTAFQKSTIGQIKANLTSAEDRYNMIIIIDDEEFDGFEAARSVWENNLSGMVIVLMISSKNKKGNYLECITMGIDSYLVKPFNGEDLVKAIRENFPFIGSQALAGDISKIRSDIKTLVVEDNKMNQKVICQMLKILGCSFDIAENGYEGYLKAKNKNYDLIFMDLVLPEIDGYESARKILKETPGILIVALTADNMPDARIKAELSGIREFIVKPVRIEDLKRLLAKYFTQD